MGSESAVAAIKRDTSIFALLLELIGWEEVPSEWFPRVFDPYLLVPTALYSSRLPRLAGEQKWSLSVIAGVHVGE